MTGASSRYVQATELGPAPGYWEVEVTFWPHWRFSSVRLEGTVN